MFDPASPSASAIRGLTWLVIVLAVAIAAIVEAILVYSLLRFRRTASADSSEPAQVYGSDPIEIAWTAAPGLVVFVLLLIVARTEWEVRAEVPEPAPGDHDLFVRVVGHQWWWEYEYEFYNGQSLRLVTANELHVPASDTEVQRTVHLTLESADVCHSFWVPRLAGKTDLIPGRANHTWFECREPGLYLGQCAEYCGTEHAGMLLRVYVDAPQDFQAWLEHQQQPSAEIAEERTGQDVFMAETCVNCHRLKGTRAEGTFGPDLTHLASRRTLASGIIDNTPDNLRRWLRDPQSIKPGCLMPALGLNNRKVDSLVRYLSTLE